MPNGLPNVHIAVISADMGAGDGSISGCSGLGNAGIFQSTARGSCTNTTLAPGATFISNVGGQRNYTGDLSDVFSCIAVLGESGCGFEHQLASVARALGADGAPAPAENAGFLRPDALLAIILVTNEDDCSAQAGVPLFDTSVNMNLASQLGPPANFRCNEFGHVCNGAAPPRNAPNGQVTDTVTLTGCAPAECGGYLTPVAEYVARIKALKAAPDQEIVVAAITGPATPYEVHWKTPSLSDTGPWPEVGHSCLAADTSFADPAIRLSAWVNAFGTNGFLSSICESNFAPALQAVGNRITTLLAAGGGTGGSGGTVIPSCPTGVGGRGDGGGGGGGGATGGRGGGGGGGSSGGTAGAAGASGATGAGGAAGAVGGAGGGAGAAAGAGGGGRGGGAAGAAGAGGAAGAAGAAGATGAAGAAGTTGAAGAAGATGAAGSAGGSGGAGASASSDAGMPDAGPGSGGGGIAGAGGSAGGAAGAAAAPPGLRVGVAAALRGARPAAATRPLTVAADCPRAAAAAAVRPAARLRIRWRWPRASSWLRWSDAGAGAAVGIDRSRRLGRRGGEARRPAAAGRQLDFSFVDLPTSSLVRL